MANSIALVGLIDEVRITPSLGGSPTFFGNWRMIMKDAPDQRTADCHQKMDRKGIVSQPSLHA
jgi:hypothetical protein